MPKIFTAVPEPARLRADIYDIWKGGGGTTATNVAMRQSLGGSLWWTGPEEWQWLKLSTTGAVEMGSTISRQTAPFFAFSKGSATIADTILTYNYNSWAYGESVTGFNNYGNQYMGTPISTVIGSGNYGHGIFNAYNSPFRRYTVRQVVYNANRQELALRATVNGTPASSAIASIMIFSSTTMVSGIGASVFEGNAQAFYSYTVGSDTTGVWMWKIYSDLPSNCYVWPDFTS